MARRSWRSIGLVLISPAIVLMILQFLVPTVATVVAGVGRENYAAIAPQLPGAFVVAVTTALTLAAAGLLGGALGAAAGRGNRVARRAAAAVAGVLVGWCAPAGMASVYGRQHPDFGASLPELLTVIGLVWAPVLVGSGALVAMVMVRPGQRIRRSTVAVVVVAGALAALAGGLQSYGVLMQVGQSVASDTLALQPLASGWLSRGQDGAASAVQSIVLAIAGVLGLAAVALLIGMGSRLVLTPPVADRPPGATGRAWVGWVGAAGLGALAVGCVILHRDWFAGVGAPLATQPDLSDQIPSIWLLAVVPTTIQVVVAAAAGLGLGYLQPFGRASRWVLLAFAPWVYVGAAPLLVHRHVAGQQGDTWVNLPAVVGFTLLFAALADARPRVADADGTKPTRRLAIILGVAASLLVGLIVLLVNAEPVPAMPATGPGSAMVPTVPAVLTVSVVTGVLAVVMTDRLTLRTGDRVRF